MKKFGCIITIALMCLALFGCQSQSPVTTQSEQYQTVVLDDPDYVHGKITDKISPNVLVLKIEAKYLADKWGETVHIVTDNIDKWNVGDEIEACFSKVERPQSQSGIVRIIAEEVLPPVYKPIIYLYPEYPTVCSVKIELDGVLTCTYPEHGDGWQNFTAYPDGTLVFPDGKEYYALYWEGLQNAEWDFTKGFCVRGEDTAVFLEWALAQQGLSPREANEFIIYWLPIMQDNPYNVIAFQHEAYTSGAVLDITPAPDSVLRVFMAYYPSDTVVDIPPQIFNGFERNGFTVVEWGGSQVTKP